ncbi:MULTISPECIES: multicopper oxidase family protein [unclassified Bradyrhizobium]|uniref:multicopper oxidase family protein n=1 Tax=unclassified Bradyrhizobium TaxID=2631580 RepID=UPI0028EEFFEC|nr:MULTISPECIES: multicopper oxidase domain-containing protein [unclassified Bradyrhizobium]
MRRSSIFHAFAFLAPFISVLLAGTHSPAADELPIPPVLQAKKGPLEILLVAREQRLAELPGSPVGWVYEACLQKDAGPDARRCPGKKGSSGKRSTCPTVEDEAVSPYGGVRLQLARTQRLKVRLVNCLPAVMKDVPQGEFKHVGENGETLLHYNPTNLHTHGLIVEPRRADDPGDSYGDYIFVLGINPANDPPSQLAHRADPAGSAMHHGGDHASQFDITPDGVINYDIDLVDHPEGLFWFHPHAHGLALNQITAGLAGIITVGSVSQYRCGAKPCEPDKVKVRHLVLKDTQLRADGTLKLQEDPKFCGELEPQGTAVLGKGLCPGAQQPTDYSQGKWLFTINGAIDPTLSVDSAGEIWRIANTSGSATYSLALQDDASGRDLQFQVLSIDGVSPDVGSQIPTARLQALFADKLNISECVASAGAPTAAGRSKPVCADRIRMMPSSRVDVWVSRKSAGVADGKASAALRSYNFNTGSAGDTWPGIELARVAFAPALAAQKPLSYLGIEAQAKTMFGPQGALGQVAKTRVSGLEEPTPISRLAAPSQARVGPSQHAAFAARLAELNAPRKYAPCSALAPDRVRQVIFGLPNEDPNSLSFGLGYREVGRDQALTAPTGDLAIKVFDHAAAPAVCLPLAAGGKGVTERWELINIAAEDHNFHIHQSRFSVVATQLPGNTDRPANGQSSPPDAEPIVLHDNIPLPSGTGCDGTVGAWKRGSCRPSRVVVDITFKEAGDFVFHCHILEHEDGGMMAKISVVPPSP